MPSHAPLTAQQAFDLALNGIRGQQYRQSAKGLNCVYRGPGGLKCAVGHMLPDDLYDPKMDDTTTAAGMLGTEFPATAALFQDVPPDLLSDLQFAHDAMAPGGAEKYEYQMQVIAKRFHLTYTPPVVGTTT